MKKPFIESNIEYILAENGMYYPNVQISKDNETTLLDCTAHSAGHTKKHRPTLYMKLILSGTLTIHLADINEVAFTRAELLERQMTEQHGITEQLKSSDWLK